MSSSWNWLAFLLSLLEACPPPPYVVDDDGDGLSEQLGDCDDTNPELFPGNPEVCDGADQDCVGGADLPGELLDADADGVLACDDCDDADPGLGSPSADAGCDGSLAPADCDDADPARGEADGLAPTCPGVDCASILAGGYSVGDGTYWIDPDGAGAVEVTCDMTTDGGGWVLVASVVAGDAHSWGTEAAWTASDDLGTLATADVADYRNRLWSWPASDILYATDVPGEYGVFGGCLAGSTLPDLFAAPWSVGASTYACVATAPVTATACESTLAFKSYDLGDEQGQTMLACRSDNSNNADNGIGLVWHNQFCSGQDFGCNPYSPTFNFEAYEVVTLWLR